MRFVLLLGLILAFIPRSHADVLSVMWTYPDQPTVPITGFRVWCGVGPGVYDPGPVAATGPAERSTQISIAQSDKRYCAVTAHNEASDSMFSNEVVLVSKPNAPIEFAISGTSPNSAEAPPPPPGTAPQSVGPQRPGVRVLPAPR